VLTGSVRSEVIAVPDRLSCPSAQPDENNGLVIGVVGSRDNGAHVSLLPQAVPLRSIAHLIPDAVPMTEVLRLTVPCAEQHCSHFRGRRCTLASRIVERLPAVVDRLSPCALRPSCRWWHQEGAAACHRCPQVVTEPFQASEVMCQIATPPASVELKQEQSSYVRD
jgi:hypothetical protein